MWMEFGDVEEFWAACLGLLHWLLKSGKLLMKFA